jgi:hypothetical protein
MAGNAPARRQKALGFLERLAAKVDSATRDRPHTDPHLIFLAPNAPMDRILDAHEREMRVGTTTGPDPARENLRWARLFEDFATFQFRPIELTDGCAPDDSMAGISDDERRAIDTVFRELRWLPPDVVNGCINREVTDLKGNIILQKCLGEGLLPMSASKATGVSPYPEIYAQPILEWALGRRFAGPEAALAHLRAQMVEHYQRLWSASTHAERLVLHHLAKHRFVNIDVTAAFGSLVRRGLVVLDPDPRLMNESFAMFVRQSEKLDPIAKLRAEVGVGPWAKAQAPVIIGITAAAGLLAALLALGDEPIRFIVPVLAAGAPVLLSTLWKSVRGA